MKLVIDTNVFVSGLMMPERKPAQILLAVVECRITPVLSRAIFDEYQDVLRRAKFRFPPPAVESLFETLVDGGLWIEPPVGNHDLPDPKDRPFLDIALFADCPIVTGNARHFPPEAGVEILTPAEWLTRRLKG